MANEEVKRLAELLRERRWAALATVDDGKPEISMVAYAAEPGLDGFLIFVSQLAAHTRTLLQEPSAALAVGEPDDGTGNPQTLARASLTVEAKPIERDSAEFAAAAECYVARLPQSQMLFSLGDFVMFRLVPSKIRWVGGFARASDVTPAELSALALPEA